MQKAVLFKSNKPDLKIIICLISAIGRVFGSQTLKAVGLLGEKFGFFSLLGLEIQRNFMKMKFKKSSSTESNL